MLKLVDVYTEVAETRVATKFLYELLKERTITTNISHREMPSFEEHCAFVDSCPYREWFLIYQEWGNVEMGPLGSIYLSKQNEIGVFISKEHQRHGYGPSVICLLMNRHPGEQFLANINPHNSRSIAMFEGLGFVLKQITYAKENKMSDFVQYRRKQIAELRPYIPGESLQFVSISAPDMEAGSPKDGDMIARNPKNHSDKWLVSAQYFADNFEPI
jgi:RimJ/RimL family protein N-acetyltransferase